MAHRNDPSCLKTPFLKIENKEKPIGFSDARKNPKNVSQCQKKIKGGLMENSGSLLT